MRPLLALLMLAALPAFAQPTYHRVTDVAANDTLNVRAEPSAASADIGDLPPFATGIEVMETDASGRWARIAWQEGDGWIAMRYLAPDPVQRLAGSILPAGLMCSGTEPFWSLRLSPGSALYSDISGTVLPMTISGTRVAAGRVDHPVQVGLSGASAAGAALVRPEICADGMSDRSYPWTVDLLLQTGDGGSYQVGCCALPLEVGSQ